MMDLIASSMTFLAAGGGGEAIHSLWTTQAAIALATLAVLEIVLGIDNIIFISVLADKLPKEQQAKARTLGLVLAMVMRVALLFCIGLIMQATTPIPVIGEMLTPLMGQEAVPVLDAAGKEMVEPRTNTVITEMVRKPFNWRDLILLGGGLFLIYKATTEIHEKLEGHDHTKETKGGVTFGSVIIQILILDIVFSLDSVITAIGMVSNPAGDANAQLIVMITAVVIAVGVMLFAAKPIADFVNRHPTVKMLAFSFLILVGVVLVIDSTHRHVPKGYIYFAMAFSVGVEMLNLKLRKKGTPVQLHEHRVGTPEQPATPTAH